MPDELLDILDDNVPWLKNNRNHISVAGDMSVLDTEWAMRSFMISELNYEDELTEKQSHVSNAKFKFTDSSMGGNIGINARPQFTRYSDVRVPGTLPGRNKVTLDNVGGNHGMGRNYSENHDDPAQTIFLRFGVPQFSALSRFVSTFADPEITSLATTGTGRSLMYKLGNAAGVVTVFFAAPAITIGLIALKAATFYFARPTSRFYSLKPTMHTYWMTVNTLVNTIAINRGLIKKSLKEGNTQRINEKYVMDDEYMSILAEMLPNIFTETYGIDVAAIANRAQRIANKKAAADFKELDNGNASDYVGYLQKQGAPIRVPNGEKPSLYSLIAKTLDIDYFTDNSIAVEPLGGTGGSDDRQQPGTGDKRGANVRAFDPKTDPLTGKPLLKPKDEPGLLNYLQAEFDMGSQFAAFKVEHTGSMSESFSNSVTESEVAGMVNSASSKTRAIKFNFAGGNMFDGILGAAESVIDGAVDVVEGAISGVTLGLSDSIAAILKGVNVEIPKRYDSSDASLPVANYSMQLISPHGNIISQIQNIYIPLCMLLAGTLPIKGGKQSNVSPFICQLFDKGRMQTQLGIITSLSITRGTSNLPFDLEGNALAIDVNFSITDLSPIMSVAISTGNIFNALIPDRQLDEDSVISDYLAVLAAQGIQDQIFAVPKAKLTFAKQQRKWELNTSKAAMAGMIHESATSGILSSILLGDIAEGLSSPRTFR